MASNTIKQQFFRLKLLQEELQSDLQDYKTLKSLSEDNDENSKLLISTDDAGDSELTSNLSKLLNIFKYIEILLIDELNDLKGDLQDGTFNANYTKFKQSVESYDISLSEIDVVDLPTKKNYKFQPNKIKAEVLKFEQVLKETQDKARTPPAKIKKSKSVRFKENLIEPSSNPSSNNLVKPYRDDPTNNDILKDNVDIGNNGSRSKDTLFQESNPSYSDDAESISSDPLSLSNRQLFISNEQELLNQDSLINSLSISVSNQREISLDINDELNDHLVLLDDLESGINSANNKVTKGRKNLTRFGEKAKKNGEWCTIFVLVVVLLLLLIILK